MERARTENNRIYKVLSSFFDMTVMKQFMVNTGKTVTIPKDSYLFVNDTKIKLKNDLEILLGTDSSNATFANYMNTKVIPELKAMYPDNLFLSSLEPKTFTDQISGKSRFIYTLGIDMMADVVQKNEKSQLSPYISSFNDLSAMNTYKGSPIQDLFFYYNLINFGNEANNDSLSPLFDFS